MPRGITPEPERTRLLATMSRHECATDELRQAVVAAHKAGGSIRDIAALINKSTNTIQRWIREA